MDRVQLADTSPWKGMPDMSDTDSTYSMNPRTARPTALGDLRFAGTIAAGLVAGTLGLGALATPLVGWKDWPSALTQQATGSPVVLAEAQTKAHSEQTPRKKGPTPVALPRWTTPGSRAPAVPATAPVPRPSRAASPSSSTRLRPRV